jgi:hypothetical protein
MKAYHAATPRLKSDAKKMQDADSHSGAMPRKTIMPSSALSRGERAKSRLRNVVVAAQHAIARFLHSCCLIEPAISQAAAHPFFRDHVVGIFRAMKLWAQCLR